MYICEENNMKLFKKFQKPAGTFDGPKPTSTKHPPDLVASIPVQILDSAPLHSIVISGWRHSLNNLAIAAAFSSEVVPR